MKLTIIFQSIYMDSIQIERHTNSSSTTGKGYEYHRTNTSTALISQKHNSFCNLLSPYYSPCVLRCLIVDGYSCHVAGPHPSHEAQVRANKSISSVSTIGSTHRHNVVRRMHFRTFLLIPTLDSHRPFRWASQLQ